MEKIVSLIICCFNGSHFIDKCFACVLNQSYKDIEVIFVDDGSKDDSFEKANSYNEKFSSEGMALKCYSQENKGAGGASALGLLHATGDYICCYDIDDVLYPDSIEKRVRYLDQNVGFSAVRTNGYKVNSIANKRTLFITDSEEKNNESIFMDLLTGKTNNWSGSYMVRSHVLWDIYTDHKLIESRYGQNLQILMAVCYNNKCGFIDEPLMEYVYNSDSFTNKNLGFEQEINNYKGFKSIRIAILQKLNIRDANIYNTLDACYSEIYMNKAIQYNKKSDFLIYYSEYLKTNKPKDIYKYYYYVYKGHKLMALFRRVVMNVHKMI